MCVLCFFSKTSRAALSLHGGSGLCTPADLGSSLPSSYWALSTAACLPSCCEMHADVSEFTQCLQHPPEISSLHAPVFNPLSLHRCCEAAGSNGTPPVLGSAQHGVQEKPAITYPGEFSPPRFAVHIPALARCQRTRSY